MTQVLLVGNPNCGKTTLFNSLTGENQRVGNWSGVTVEKKTGHFTIEQQHIEITDLPGVYSLTINTLDANQDEQVTATAIASIPADIIINVIDACHLERHLYLTSQLLELGRPVIIVLNMMDIARQRGITINIPILAAELNSLVVAVEAHQKIGIDTLRQTIATLSDLSPTAQSLTLSLPTKLLCKAHACSEYLIASGQIKPELINYYTWRLLEGDQSLSNSTQLNTRFLSTSLASDDDIIIADARYQKIHDIVSLTYTKASDASEHLTAKIDKIVLHQYLALPIFLALMYLMFLFAINVGGAFQDFFDITTDTIFVKGMALLLQQLSAPAWLIALIAYGLGTGINTTLTFIPVIAAMFFFLALLESSGYMARAAFVVDKAMRMLGLPGKSFVPMIVGFGCNVPAIMAARTLDSERDRLLTVLMSPFMSCSARLAIYAVFVAAFFPTGGQNIVFCLYLIGIFMAVITGFLLRKTTLGGFASPLILELPAYHRPSLKRLINDTTLRLRYFISRAGRMIIPVCILLGGLNMLTIDGGLSTGDTTQSILSFIGQWLTPIFSPMGLHQNNWPATVGLLTGMLAKEVVVGSLNSLYSQLGHVNLMSSMAVNLDFLGSLKTALGSVFHNVAGLGHALTNPIAASAPDNQVSQSVYGMMVARFDGKIGAFSYLLFILLYIPCVSTMAAISQEANRKLMWFSIVWSFLVAYATAVGFYQLATFTKHPGMSISWLIILFASISFFIAGLHYQGTRSGARNVVTNS